MSAGIDTATWMGQVPSALQDRPVNKLVVPGTHDSGTYKLDPAQPLGPPSQLREASIAISRFPFATEIAEAWSCTQSQSIYGQLKQGHRFFHLRLAPTPDGDSFFISHSFACVPLDTVLKNIKAFLTESPKEVVYLNFAADYPYRHSMGTAQNNAVLKLLQDAFGSLLCRPNADSSYDRRTSLSKLWKHGKRIITYYEGDYDAKTYPFVWDNDKLNIPWPDTSDLSEKERDLQQNLQEAKPSTSIVNGLSFTLTPQKSDVVDDVIGRIFEPKSHVPQGVDTMAAKIDATLPGFIAENQAEIREKISLITMDFPTAALAERVIQLNFPRS